MRVHAPCVKHPISASSLGKEPSGALTKEGQQSNMGVLSTVFAKAKGLNYGHWEAGYRFRPAKQAELSKTPDRSGVLLLL
jgi:hypothetical protein